MLKPVFFSNGIMKYQLETLTFEVIGKDVIFYFKYFYIKKLLNLPFLSNKKATRFFPFNFINAALLPLVEILRVSTT